MMGCHIGRVIAQGKGYGRHRLDSSRGKGDKYLTERDVQHHGHRIGEPDSQESGNQGTAERGSQQASQITHRD